MSPREDGEIAASPDRQRRRRDDQHRRRNRSRSRSARRRRRTSRSPRRSHRDDKSRRRPDARRNRRRSPERRPPPPAPKLAKVGAKPASDGVGNIVIESAQVVETRTQSETAKPIMEIVNTQREVEEYEEVDEEAYAQRVEMQLESIRGADKEMDVEEDLRQRRERRQAILLSLQQTPKNRIETIINGSAFAEADESLDEVEPPIEEREDPVEEPRFALEMTGTKPVEEAEEKTVVEESSNDGLRMDDPSTDIDIFGDSPVAVVKPTDAPIIPVVAADHHLTDNWDDAEGYYTFRLGDVLHDGRYEVFANQGRGVFSTVLRVRDRIAGNRELVVKVIRQNDVMYKAGLKEVSLLKILGANDPDNRRHCVRLYSHFEHRGHLCLVFEPLHMNLREVLKKYGGVGINIDGVRSYAKQLFVALRLLGKCEIVHADIKPDNILVNSTKNVLKLCDFGSAGMVSDCDITPYLVSRFYRAPEIILGLPYGPPIDVWAVGCVLFELYTGQILFRGADNNEMLLRVMELRGRLPPRLLKRATFASQHFDSEWIFERRRTDKVTGAEIKTKMRIERPVRDLQTLLRQSAGRLTDAEMKSLSQLRDLLEKCLMLDPAKRITPELLRLHPFLQQ